MILDSSSKNCCNLKTSHVDAESEISVIRCTAATESFPGRFKFREKDFSRQYAYAYATRLKALQDAVKENCFLKWGNEIPIRKLSELAELKDERCIVIGTIFKRQELIPSILKEISEENQLLPQPRVTNYVSSSDQLIIEDELQRMPLAGNIQPNEFVSGVVLAVLGQENENGLFEVEDYVFGSRKGTCKEPDSQVSDEKFILLVSGLDIGESTNMLSLQMMVDWVNGELGCPSDQHSNSKICRVLIAGNSVKKSKKISTGYGIISMNEEYSDLLSSIQQLDKLLLDLVKSVDVDLMPGEFDPTNHTLPQQPFHQCILPKCSRYETLHRVSNPHEIVLDGKRILGSAGQPVNDIKSLSTLSDNLSILESTLRWGHLAPTAPDTIACYPYTEDDPFVITEQPDVYFTGSASSFETKLIHLNGSPVRLICLPVFSQTQTCALLNMKTLDCTPLKFRVFEGLDT